MCNTKTNSLGREIKSTFTDSATVKQLPQSGIGWDTTLVTQFNPQHDRCTTILTDWNLRLKHARWLPAYSSAARPMLDRLDWFVGKLTTEMVNSAPFCRRVLPPEFSWGLFYFYPSASPRFSREVLFSTLFQGIQLTNPIHLQRTSKKASLHTCHANCYFFATLYLKVKDSNSLL